MDSIQHRAGEGTGPGGQKVPMGTLELVEGKVGHAVQFCFTNIGPGFMTAPVRPSAEWNAAEGFSFLVKGDGSTNWGGLEMIDANDYSLRYGYCFPINSKEWRKITVAWSDLTPELASPLVDAKTGYAPSGFGNLWFGKWFYWREFPAHCFVIDQVMLEPKVSTSGGAFAIEPALKRTQAKLKTHQPLSIVTLGDSLTDKRHWANAQSLWCELLARRLKEQFQAEVKIHNPAIGGTTLCQNLVLLPRALAQDAPPDLVTIWFGYNDWDSGVRSARFKAYLSLAVDRIRRDTQGRADILILTTCPAFARWETMKELEQSAREVAQKKQVGLADIAAVFRETGTAESLMTQGYWAWDKTHLGPKGHELVATTVLKILQPTSD